MPALTVKQPWAGLIASGQKTIENRSLPIKFRGLLAIHAGKATCPGLSATDLDRLQREHLASSGQLPPTDRRSGFVALVQLVDCVDVETALRLRPDQEEFISGPWCWLLDQAVPTWVPYSRGQLGLWVPKRAEVPLWLWELLHPQLLTERPGPWGWSPELAVGVPSPATVDRELSN